VRLILPTHTGLQGRRKSSCVIEVDIDGLFAVPLPRFHLFLVSGRSDDLDVRRSVSRIEAIALPVRPLAPSTRLALL